jgi:hypothetical protein
MIMSTTTHFDGALGFEPAKPAAERRNFLSRVITLWQALGEGFAAAKHYQQLTARGMSHEEAASKVFHEHYAAR